MDLEELTREEEVLEQDSEEEVEEYELSDKQEAFIFDEHKFSGYGGGVGNGKSFAGCIKAHRHCEEQPGAFFLIGRKDAVDLEDSTQKDFLALFGDEGTFAVKTRTFTYPNGSQIIFRHLAELSKLTNMNLSGFWIDQAEEVTEAAFKQLIGRIRRQKGPRGQKITRREGFITFNMQGHNWIWRRFLKKLDDSGKALAKPEDYFLVTATSLEMKHTPQDYRDTLMSQSAAWIKRWVYGDWDEFAGQIFDEWSPAIHVVRPFLIPNSWPRYRSIDHGQNNPTCCLWFAVDFDGNVYCYQEYYEPNELVSNHVKNILEMSRIAHSGGGWSQDEYDATFIDPSTHAQTKEKNGHKYSVADEYSEAGLLTVGAQNDVLAGINRVKEYLKINPKRWHPTKYDVGGMPMQGSPRLFVFENCTNLTEEMGDYHWKPLRAGSEDSENNPEKPVKNKDHACFAAGTKIKTKRGDVFIEDVRAGDFVVTPFGHAEVTSAGSMGVRTVKDYGTFSATPDHPVLSNKGIHQVDDLGYNDYIWVNHETKQFTSREYLIAGILTQRNEVRDFIFDALLPRVLTARQGTYTDTSGFCITAPFLADMRYITKTATMTTRSALLNLLPTLSMPNYTSGESPLQAISTASALLRKSGTVQPQELLGIADMVKNSGRVAREQAQSVLSAVESMILHSLVAVSTVIQTAKQQPSEDAEVFNLATKDGMYFANGVLVSNCDALRYFLMSRPINPMEQAVLDPRLLNNPIELARYCQSLGITVDDFLASKYGVGNVNKIGHSSSGIGHSTEGINHSHSLVG